MLTLQVVFLELRIIPIIQWGIDTNGINHDLGHNVITSISIKKKLSYAYNLSHLIYLSLSVKWLKAGKRTYYIDLVFLQQLVIMHAQNC